MKKLVCELLVCVLFAGGALGCTKKDEVPARGVWDGRTYTNTEAGIRLTVPEGYKIDTDEELIQWSGVSEDYYDDVEGKTSYTDIHVTEEASRIYIQYMINQSTALNGEQYLNNLMATNKTKVIDEKTYNRIYSDITEKTLCGEQYSMVICTLDGEEDYYNVLLVRFISGKVLTFIDIAGENENQVNAYLAFFDTASVNSEK